MVGNNIVYREITAADSAAVIDLANSVHGDNYLNGDSLAALLEGGTVGDTKLNFLAEKEGEVVGVRLTLAPGNWSIDEACTPEEWPVEPEHICYFKCAAVAESARGLGIGKQLLQKSISAAESLGCRAGLAHIWLQSPANSAYEYFSRCGGVLVNRHPDRWLQASLEDGYYCPVCDGNCRCDAGEMILMFDA
ncbi:MAG: GNAT family N-acetyltransferase [Pseudomonadota bacterium]